MKITNNHSKLITKSDFKQEIERLERSFDKKFTTKEDLKKLRVELLADSSMTEQRAKDREEKYRSEVMTSFDKVMKRLDNIDHNIEVGNSQVKETLEDHENRLKRLEKVGQN